MPLWSPGRAAAALPQPELRDPGAADPGAAPGDAGERTQSRTPQGRHQETGDVQVPAYLPDHAKGQGGQLPEPATHHGEAG